MRIQTPSPTDRVPSQTDRGPDPIISIAEASKLPTLREVLLAARRCDPAVCGKTVRAWRADGAVMSVKVGPRGGVTRRVISRTA